MRTPLLAVAVSLLLCGVAQAETINVPADYPTIQGAINASSDGDVIQIAAGQHVADMVDTLGKQLHLIGVGEETLLEPSSNGRILYIHSGEGPLTHFESMTFSGTNANDSAVRLYGVSITFTDCIFRDNNSLPYNGGGYDSPGRGGAVYGSDSSPRFESCTFEGNSAVGDYYFGSEGGAVVLKNSSPVFIGCTFRENSCDHLGGLGGAGKGGALYLSNCDDVVLQECLFEGNEIESDADGGRGGAIYMWYVTGSMTSCSFLANQTMSDPAPYSRGGAIYAGRSPILINTSHFASNTSEGGAAMYISYDNPTLTDTSFCDHAENVIEGEWNDGGGNSFELECPADCDGDITGDGMVNVDDLLAVIAGWGDPYDVDDLLAVIASWGPCQ